MWVGNEGLICLLEKEKKKTLHFVLLHKTYLISSVSGTLVYGSIALTLLRSSTGCEVTQKPKIQSVYIQKHSRSFFIASFY